MNSSNFKRQSLRINLILYRNASREIEQSLDNLARAIKLAFRTGMLSYVEIQLGDCSSSSIYTEEQIVELGSRYYAFDVAKIGYEFFNYNIGSAAGHNRLFTSLSCDLVLLLNPVVIVAPNFLIELLQPISDPAVGIIEARQIPIENPKAYDSVTGDTSWATTDCTLIRRSVVATLNGFDHSFFSLSSADVDFSWRARLAGYRVVFCPLAVAFNDKRLKSGAQLSVTPLEEFHNTEGAILLAYKYSRSDLVEKIANDLSSNGTQEQKQAVESYYTRQKKGNLPTQIDSDHQVGQFINGAYAYHRF